MDVFLNNLKLASWNENWNKNYKPKEKLIIKFFIKQPEVGINYIEDCKSYTMLSLFMWRKENFEKTWLSPIEVKIKFKIQSSFRTKVQLWP